MQSAAIHHCVIEDPEGCAGCWAGPGVGGASGGCQTTNWDTKGVMEGGRGGGGGRGLDRVGQGQGQGGTKSRLKLALSVQGEHSLGRMTGEPRGHAD